MKEQRTLNGLRAHVDQLLQQGWKITAREPLLLKYGRNRLRYDCGMLISEIDSDLDVELRQARRRA
ncbi:hypothetical protein [Pseudomonas panipatensis]|uniref:Uncharacterized protein n=1 Tax=Pseudomonas panipatensis TaxID=428992 RepID=A0A1G8CW62_9PSED|nr:hypothetical protein [Pseudomonas panipatensis]SDH49725.1 hypothetical protein SAMN05216272_101802 [Pseudomonas panipatensis]SMP63294.1 hypothetical protein SAMN06295951_10640 [Pseudomonas panipatensis]